LFFGLRRHRIALVSGGISPKRRRAAGLSLAIVGTLALGAVAWAGGPATPTIDAMDQTSFSSVPDEVSPGSRVNFSNQDVVTHNVTADEKGPDGKALFRTDNVGGGNLAEVRGVRFLEVGSYPFTCTIHPNMQAVLTIGGDGPGPFPRPEIDVKVKSKKLAKVVESGKLKVKVSADEPTDADGVSLRAKKGAKGITKKANLNLNAGDSKTAKLKLKKKALEKLADLEKAKVKVQGTVDFGFGNKAAKKLK
jgi:plastocyanin